MSIYKIYCDESGIDTRGRYVFVGGLWILKQEGWNFVNSFEDFCDKELGLRKPLKHIKWTNVPTKPNSTIYRAYQYLVDLYFEYNRNKKASFRTLVVEKNQYQFTHPKFYNDYEEGFYNLYCQLIVHWLGRDNDYHVRIAKRDIKKAFCGDCEKVRLEMLRGKLNRKFEQKLNRYAQIMGYRSVTPPIKTIEARPAKDRRLIQIVDILMGAVNYHWNGEHTKCNASPGRTSLAGYISCRLEKTDLVFSTDWNNKRFNIFSFKPGRSKK